MVAASRVFLKRLSQFQDMFLVVKVGISRTIHSESLTSCELSALLLSDNQAQPLPRRDWSNRVTSDLIDSATVNQDSVMTGHLQGRHMVHW